MKPSLGGSGLIHTGAMWEDFQFWLLGFFFIERCFLISCLVQFVAWSVRAKQIKGLVKPVRKKFKVFLVLRRPLSDCCNLYFATRCHQILHNGCLNVIMLTGTVYLFNAATAFICSEVSTGINSVETASYFSGYVVVGDRDSSMHHLLKGSCASCNEKEPTSTTWRQFQSRFSNNQDVYIWGLLWLQVGMCCSQWQRSERHIRIIGYKRWKD